MKYNIHIETDQDDFSFDDAKILDSQDGLFFVIETYYKQTYIPKADIVIIEIKERC